MCRRNGRGRLTTKNSGEGKRNALGPIPIRIDKLTNIEGPIRQLSARWIGGSTSNGSFNGVIEPESCLSISGAPLTPSKNVR